MDQVVERDNLLRTLKQVQRNGGSPGIDGMTVEELAPYLKEHWPRVKQALVEGTYQPQPVKRVEVPKPQGGMRKLGVPTVLDRFIQQAVMQVLQAQWDPTFSEASFGFRPGRNAQQAVKRAQSYLKEGYTWVVDMDLEKFFDSLPHAVILACLRKRIKDERFIDCIRRLLQAGVMEQGRYERTYSGAPPGGMCSPILMNIVLHEFDGWMEEQGQANQPVPHRAHPAYARLQRNLVRWRGQRRGRIPRGRQTVAGLRRKIAAAEAARHHGPSYAPRQTLSFCRYADDVRRSQAV